MPRTEVLDVTGAIERPSPEQTLSVFTRITNAIDLSDVLVVLGLLLWVLGFWGEWRIALGVPGAVLVLWALPPRPPFVQRDTRVKG